LPDEYSPVSFVGLIKEYVGVETDPAGPVIGNVVVIAVELIDNLFTPAVAKSRTSAPEE